MKELINTLAQLFESHFIEENMNEEYPSSFDKEEFKSLTSFRKRIEYCEKHLKRLGSGSSRIVYQIDNEKVLKLAKNKKGIAQNEVEHTYSQDSFLDDIFAEVYDVDEDGYLWIEMQLAKKLNKGLFKSITGLSFEEYSDAIRYYDSIANPRNYRHYKVSEPANMDELYEHDLLRGIFDYIGNFSVPAGDLMRMSSYGVVGNNEIVLIDYGLDNDVASDYYS